MGLTIHYNLETKLTRPEEIRRLVDGLRQYAMDLPFQEVDDVVEFKGEDVSYQNQDDPHRWLKIQAGQYLNDGPYSYSVAPSISSPSPRFPAKAPSRPTSGFAVIRNQSSRKTKGGSEPNSRVGCGGPFAKRSMRVTLPVAA